MVSSHPPQEVCHLGGGSGLSADGEGTAHLRQPISDRLIIYLGGALALARAFEGEAVDPAYLNLEPPIGDGRDLTRGGEVVVCLIPHSGL